MVKCETHNFLTVSEVENKKIWRCRKVERERGREHEIIILIFVMLIWNLHWFPWNSPTMFYCFILLTVISVNTNEFTITFLWSILQFFARVECFTFCLQYFLFLTWNILLLLISTSSRTNKCDTLTQMQLFIFFYRIKIYMWNWLTWQMHLKHFISLIESTATSSPSFEHGSLRPTAKPK